MPSFRSALLVVSSWQRLVIESLGFVVRQSLSTLYSRIVPYLSCTVHSSLLDWKYQTSLFSTSGSFVTLVLWNRSLISLFLLLKYNGLFMVVLDIVGVLYMKICFPSLYHTHTWFCGCMLNVNKRECSYIWSLFEVELFKQGGWILNRPVTDQDIKKMSYVIKSYKSKSDKGKGCLTNYF